MPNKRVCVIGDLHSGHRVGLTPPAWQWKLTGYSDTTQQDKWATIQKSLWLHYLEALEKVKPIDILIVNGDCINGKGSKSGSTEEITAARDNQAKMAAHCIIETHAPVIRMTYGTAYHVGADEDWENAVVNELKILDAGLNIKIGSHDWFDINGVVFDVKHFTSASSIPHGKGTALGKEWLWNFLWAEQGLQPKADIYVRHHVHYAFHCGEPNKWYAFTGPALQGMGSKFGSRICKGLVHFGMVTFDITESGAWMPHWDIINIQEQATEAEIL